MPLFLKILSTKLQEKGLKLYLGCHGGGGINNSTPELILDKVLRDDHLGLKPLTENYKLYSDSYYVYCIEPGKIVELRYDVDAFKEYIKVETKKIFDEYQEDINTDFLLDEKNANYSSNIDMLKLMKQNNLNFMNIVKLLKSEIWLDEKSLKFYSNVRNEDIELILKCEVSKDLFSKVVEYNGQILKHTFNERVSKSVDNICKLYSQYEYGSNQLKDWYTDMCVDMKSIFDSIQILSDVNLNGTRNELIRIIGIKCRSLDGDDHDGIELFLQSIIDEISSCIFEKQVERCAEALHEWFTINSNNSSEINTIKPLNGFNIGSSKEELREAIKDKCKESYRHDNHAVSSFIQSIVDEIYYSGKNISGELHIIYRPMNINLEYKNLLKNYFYFESPFNQHVGICVDLLQDWYKGNQESMNVIDSLDSLSKINLDTPRDELVKILRNQCSDIDEDIGDSLRPFLETISEESITYPEIKGNPLEVYNKLFKNHLILKVARNNEYADKVRKLLKTEAYVSGFRAEELNEFCSLPSDYQDLAINIPSLLKRDEQENHTKKLLSTKFKLNVVVANFITRYIHLVGEDEKELDFDVDAIFSKENINFYIALLCKIDLWKVSKCIDTLKEWYESNAKCKDKIDAIPKLFGINLADTKSKLVDIISNKYKFEVLNFLGSISFDSRNLKVKLDDLMNKLKYSSDFRSSCITLDQFIEGFKVISLLSGEDKKIISEVAEFKSAEQIHSHMTQFLHKTSTKTLNDKIEQTILECFNKLKLKERTKDATLKINLKGFTEVDLEKYCNSQLKINSGDLEFEGSICWISLDQASIKILHEKIEISKASNRKEVYISTIVVDSPIAEGNNFENVHSQENAEIAKIESIEVLGAS